ncbi:hypothetical protein [Desulfosarcina alkanivorans]|nr:hypothetical protein [Desulfosarcina alkanivorans]
MECIITRRAIQGTAHDAVLFRQPLYILLPDTNASSLNDGIFGKPDHWR